MKLLKMKRYDSSFRNEVDCFGVSPKYKNMTFCWKSKQNLMKKHRAGQNVLILVTSNDIRKKNDGKGEAKQLTDEQKQDYFKCVELIMSALSDTNKATLLREYDSSSRNALMWACINGNMQSAKYLLEHCPDDKTKKAMIDQKTSDGFNCFHSSIRGGNMKLIRLIHETFRSFHKDDDLIKENKALRVAFQQGEMVCLVLYL